MNRIGKCYLAITIIVVSIFLTGCKKEKVPDITTTSVSSITATSATSGGNITDEGSSTVISRGICWSTGSTPTIADSKTSDGAGVGSYVSNMTGLNGGSTYYVRAYATNSAGTGYGMAVSLTTLGQPPAPTISAATNISSTTATLNGSVNANYLSTIVTFEYGMTTSYGNTATPLVSTISGNTSTNISADISGLKEGGTDYHVRLKAVNSLGTTYSNDITFTTLGQVPTATTVAATNLSAIGAQLNGSVNANYLSTVVTFEYGMTTSYGNTATSTQNPITGNSNKSVSAVIIGLTPKTTYHFRVTSVNSLGTIYGNDLTFTTLGESPTSTTQAATNLTTTSVTINGIVNANFLSTTVIFEYGTTITYDNSVTANQSPVTGNSTTSVSVNVLGLSPNTIYHYRVKAVNILGTTYGIDMTFTTLGLPPTVITGAASNIQPFSSTLNGTVNANYLSSTVTFEYGTTTSYGNTVTATQSPVTGNTNTSVSIPVASLEGGTIYHFRIKAVNSLGTSYGNDLQFTTLGQIPTVTTLAATTTTPTTAQLNGTVNANYLSSTVTFEYGTTTSYGNTVTATQSPVTGNTNTSVSVPVTGLAYNLTYHFRIKAINSLGATYGNDMTFTTVYTIGENVNGGLIFYIDGTGQHGLVCAPSDQSTGAPWSCAGPVTGANGTAVGTGSQNTIDIVNACSTSLGIAARICSNLNLNGYTDWFLPSKDELYLMYTNLQMNGFGNFALYATTDYAYYWSSSQSGSMDAWVIRFSGGGQAPRGSYTYPCFVRSVRAF